MSCNSYDECGYRERDTLKYPIDSRSLYANRIYDNQTLNRRCYQKNPIEIIEGFGLSFTWDQLIKFIIVVLLIILFFILAKDFIMPKQVLKLDVPTTSEIDIATPTIAKPIVKPTKLPRQL